LATVRLALRLLPLLVVFVDSIGYTIVVPVLADAFLSEAPILMPHSSLGARYMIYGDTRPNPVDSTTLAVNKR
jgi:hypothetical protein